MPLIKEFKTPELNEIFKDNIDDKPLIKKKKVIVKKPSKPNNFEYDVQTIEDDYKYFNIDFEPKNSNIKYQEKFVELNKMSFKALFQFEHHNFEKKEDYKVVDLNTYKLILFLNVCYDEKNNEKYELFDEHFEIPVMKNYKKFYEGDFNTYFNNKYKDNSVLSLNIEIMSRIKLFNYHYDKIYPHNFNRVDNPTEYNKVSKNKSNLKTQYRKYLEGNDISTLNNIPALKMIIYIIENVEIN